MNTACGVLTCVSMDTSFLIEIVYESSLFGDEYLVTHTEFKLIGCTVAEGDCHGALKVRAI
jgi:hypothetical protein